MSKQYALKDRDGTIRDEPSRRQALREQKAYGGMVVSRSGEAPWKPYKPHKIFLWVFLIIQAIFIIWLIVGITSANTTPSASDIAALCGGGKWQPYYDSYAGCVKDAGSLISGAKQVGTAIGAGLVAGIWVGVDIVLGIGYGIYRLSRR